MNKHLFGKAEKFLTIINTNLLFLMIIIFSLRFSGRSAFKQNSKWDHLLITDSIHSLEISINATNADHRRPILISFNAPIYKDYYDTVMERRNVPMSGITMHCNRCSIQKVMQRLKRFRHFRWVYDNKDCQLVIKAKSKTSGAN